MIVPRTRRLVRCVRMVNDTSCTGRGPGVNSLVFQLKYNCVRPSSEDALRFQSEEHSAFFASGAISEWVRRATKAVEIARFKLIARR